MFKKISKFTSFIILRFERNFHFSNFLNFPGYARIRNFTTLSFREIAEEWNLSELLWDQDFVKLTILDFLEIIDELNIETDTFREFD